MTTGGAGRCARSRTSMSASTGPALCSPTAPTPWAASTAPAGRATRATGSTAAPTRRPTLRRRRRMTAFTGWSRPTSTLAVSVCTTEWSTRSWRRSGLGDSAVTVTVGTVRSLVRTTPPVSPPPHPRPAPPGTRWTASRTPGWTTSSSQSGISSEV